MFDVIFIFLFIFIFLVAFNRKFNIKKEVNLICLTGSLLCQNESLTQGELNVFFPSNGNKIY